MPSTSSPAIAKAKLLSTVLVEASRAQLDTNAFALLALLIAESWPMDDGWATSMARSTMAQRLSCSVATIDRARQALTTAGLIQHRPGDARHASMFVICCSPTGETPAVSPVRPQESHPCDPRSLTRETLAVSPVRPSSGLNRKTQQQQQREPSSAPSTDAPAAGIAAPLSQESIDQRFRSLRRRPEWLHESKPWITSDVVLELVRRPEISDELITQVLRQARDSRNTLTNPAGWIVAQLRRSATINP